MRTREWYGQLSCFGATGMPTGGCLEVDTGAFLAGGRQNDCGLRDVVELPCNVLVLNGGGTRCLAAGEQKRWTLVLGVRPPLKPGLELPSSF